MSSALTPVLESHLLTQSFDTAATHAALSTTDSIAKFSRSLSGDAASGLSRSVQADAQLNDRLTSIKSALHSDTHGPAGVDVAYGAYTPEEIEALESVNFDSSFSSKTSLAASEDNHGGQDILTFVLDFKEASQGSTFDIFNNEVTDFDVTSYGFAAGDFDTVANAILAEVDDDYFAELVGTVAGPAGMDLEVDFIIGDIGTAPVGVSEYYYIQIGTGVAGPHTGGTLGVAGGSVVRNTGGAGPNFGIAVGDVVSSVFTDAIVTLSGVGTALTSGEIVATTHGIGGTTSHEIGHTLSLSHINTVGSVQPSGASPSIHPIMGTGAIDLPNAARITDREFSLSGVDGQNGNAPRDHIAQLTGAVGLHAPPVIPDLLVNYQYDPSEVAYVFDDISTTGNQILIGADDSSIEINDAALGDFQFDFYGERYYSLNVSSNGLITFDGADISAANSNLTASPDLATIATFWDDLVSSGGVFWEVKGTGEDEQLVIQWNNVTRPSAPGTGTFQAVLGEDDTIQFNYQDLVFGDNAYDNGASASVGIKAAGDQSTDGNQVLISQDNGASGLVADNKSILFDYNGAYVNGTANDDNVTFEAGDLTHLIVLGGSSATVNALAVEDLTIYGMGGTDQLSMVGGSQDDTFVLKDGVGRFTNDNLLFVGDSFETISADGGAGWDQAYFFDDAADNEFRGSPENASLTGGGIDYRTANMEKIRAIASDGNDVAYLSDSSFNDRYIGKENVSILVGGQFHNEVRGFDTVVASATAGNDRAIFYDSAGDDRFVGRTNFSELIGDGFHNTARAFDRVFAYASTGNDTSYLYDSVGSDRLIARKTHSILYGSNFYNQSRGFDKTYAYASQGSDVALLHDTAGNDVFTGRHNYSRITGAGYLAQAVAFDKVWAYASKGNDIAYLSDHTTNDVFYGYRRYSRLFGGGFFNQANNFDKVFASASVGNDRAFVFGSSGSDTLFGNKNIGILYGVDFYNHYRNFDFVSAHGLAGVDRANTSKNLHYKLKSYVFA